MERRSLIKWIFGASVLTFVGAKAPLLLSATDNESEHFFKISKGTSELGKRYLEAYPEERELCKTLSLDLRAKNISRFDTKEFALKIREDFRNANTVVLDGWVMSKTELRLSTLNIV